LDGLKRYRCSNCRLPKPGGEDGRCPRCGCRFEEYTPWQASFRFSLKSIFVATTITALFCALFNPLRHPEFCTPILMLISGEPVYCVIGGILCAILLPMIFLPVVCFNRLTALYSIIGLILWYSFGLFVHWVAEA
jgi:hypothetical protein